MFNKNKMEKNRNKQELIREFKIELFIEGIGNAEPLKYQLSGDQLRRISQ